MLDYVRRQLAALGAAIQLLTRLPLPVQIDYRSEVLIRSTNYYPVVGLIIGGLTGAAFWLLPQLWSETICAALILIVWVALTGGLHLDGLMDTADGVLSHRSRERMLEIMKDSRSGAMGVLAGVLTLLLKFVLILECLKWDRSDVWLYWMLIPMWARWGTVFAMALWPYARKEQGMGSYYQSVGLRQTAVSGWIALLSSLLLLIGSYRWNGGDVVPLLYTGLAVIGACVLTVLLAGGWLYRKLGGQTGDTYGAMIEVSELMMLLTLVTMNGR
ncbi:adenosylcobinamide-GDP ribazoletransferase [Marinicrinis lubricantis]|uniref:Adenosylcobinamide-GDP ribazoletransferase n=1 Tax=Marinicrinis lubricantis TaxID=2086470 RepID=A0ABW1IRS6_9BACL